MIGLKLFFCYKTVFLPTKQMFFGIHCTDDMNFGTAEYKDPFVGSGIKIKELVQRGAKRHHFTVQALALGDQDTAQRMYDRIVFDYDHPLCLNTKPGAPAGVPKTEEHKANIGEALQTAMVDNTNALGVSKTPNGGKLKWYNNGEVQLQLETVKDNVPVDSTYVDWKLGQLPKPTAAELAKSKKATVSTANLGWLTKPGIAHGPRSIESKRKQLATLKRKMLDPNNTSPRAKRAQARQPSPSLGHIDRSHWCPMRMWEVNSVTSLTVSINEPA